MAKNALSSPFESDVASVPSPRAGGPARNNVTSVNKPENTSVLHTVFNVDTPNTKHGNYLQSPFESAIPGSNKTGGGNGAKRGTNIETPFEQGVFKSK